MNIKKLIITVTAAVLAIALLVTAIVLFTRNDCVISIENKTALAGDTVKLSVNIKNNPGIWGGQIIIDYDSDTLTFNTASNGTVFDSCEFNDTGSSVVLLVTQASLKNTKENSTVAIISFNVKESAKNGETDIVLNEDSNFCNAKEELVKTTFENGYITIK